MRSDDLGHILNGVGDVQRALEWVQGHVQFGETNVRISETIKPDAAGYQLVMDIETLLGFLQHLSTSLKQHLGVELVEGE